MRHPSADSFRDAEFRRGFYRDMVRTRVLEEQLIGLWKKGQGFFWTGGPGEEAAQVALARLLRVGQGVDFDYFHPHYRNLGVMVALGAPMVNAVRQMKNLSTDPYSGGRNFGSHSAVPAWNIIPVSSPVATQCLLGTGTAFAQARRRRQTGVESLSVVVIGEASSASPDFASSLIWSSRPGQNIPLLTVITNNGVGISTRSSAQLAAIHERARAFGIEAKKADGLHAKKAWIALCTAFDHVRRTGRPYVLELEVSRVYGHSSSSGANRAEDEICPLELFEKELLRGDLSASDLKRIREEAVEEFQAALQLCEGETYPSGDTVLRHAFSE